ncbi:MAG: hypothetical protein JSW41_04645 [Candidatus Aenigmatarchaeota archaeon]|nr:MAG: hypothetical protein JSW41_04645 [Candidatus Aenigmarchaeota archaeon]
MEVKLYHFTSVMHHQIIQNEKKLLPMGDVPITYVGGFKALWFTLDPDPNNQQWGMPHKNAVRYEVSWPLDKTGLAKWTDIAAAFNMDEVWYASLASSGGGKPEDWYVYVQAVDIEDCIIRTIV